MVCPQILSACYFKKLNEEAYQTFITDFSLELRTGNVPGRPLPFPILFFLYSMLFSDKYITFTARDVTYVGKFMQYCTKLLYWAPQNLPGWLGMKCNKYWTVLPGPKHAIHPLRALTRK